MGDISRRLARFLGKPSPYSGIMLPSANDVVDEAPPCRKIVEVSQGAQQRSVGKRSLEMAVGALDRARSRG